MQFTNVQLFLYTYIQDVEINKTLYVHSTYLQGAGMWVSHVEGCVKRIAAKFCDTMFRQSSFGGTESRNSA